MKHSSLEDIGLHNPYVLQGFYKFLFIIYAGDDKIYCQPWKLNYVFTYVWARVYFGTSNFGYILNYIYYNSH